MTLLIMSWHIWVFCFISISIPSFNDFRILLTWQRCTYTEHIMKCIINFCLITYAVTCLNKLLVVWLIISHRRNPKTALWNKCHSDNTIRLYKSLWAQLNRNVRKYTFWHVRKTKTQISLRTCAVCSVFVVTWRNFASWVIHFVPSEDSDQNMRTRRLIWISVGCTCPNVCFLNLRLIYIIAILTIRI